MVNFKSMVTLGLMVSTASAALKHDKRHVHHRRAKAPCSTSTIATTPFPIGNSTQPAGTGAVSTSTDAASTSSESVVTYTVIPVPVSTTSVASPSSVASSSVNAGTSLDTSAASDASSTPASNGGSACGVATSYVTVQQTVTVTVDQASETTSEVVVVPSSTAVSAVSSSTATSSSSSSSFLTTAAVETTATIETTAIPSPGAFAQTGGSGGDASLSSSSPSPSPSTSSTAEEHYTTTTEAPASSSSSTNTRPSTYTGAKHGVAFDPNHGYDFPSLKISGVPWLYDWGQVNQGQTTGSTQYIPTLHSADKVSGFAAQLASQNGVTFVKHLNEPDKPSSAGGSLLSPAQAAAIHKDHIAQISGKYSIGFPAITSYDTQVSKETGFQSGFAWLDAFIDQVGCDDFAFMDLHWYGWQASAADQAKVFLEYIDEAVTRFDAKCSGHKPIWCTEFAAIPVTDTSLQTAFLAIVTPELEKNSRVARYSPYVQDNIDLGGILGTIAAAVAGN